MENKLLDLLKASGKKRLITVNEDIILKDPEQIWYLESGKVSLSTVNVKHGEAAGTRQFFFNAEAGSFLFGMPLSGTDPTYGMIVEAFEESEFHEFKLSDFKRLIEENSDMAEEAAKIVEDWAKFLFAGVQEGNLKSAPKADLLLTPGVSAVTDSEKVVSTTRNLLWIKSSKPNTLIFDGYIPIESLKRDILLPIARNHYFLTTSEISFEAFNTADIIDKEGLWEGFLSFYDTVLDTEIMEAQQIKESETKRLEKKYRTEQTNLRSVLEGVKNILQPENEGDFTNQSFAKSTDPLFRACSVIGAHFNINIEVPNNYEKSRDQLADICRYANLRYRDIELDPDWYKFNAGPLLVYDAATGDPYAAIPNKKGVYVTFDPQTKKTSTLNSVTATKFDKSAFCFYESFPDKPMTLKEILRFAILPDKKDYMWVILMSAIVTMLGMVTPVLIGTIYDYIIPHAEREQLIHVSLALLVSSICFVLFNITKNYTLLKINGNSNSRLQAALWDRILQLPARFFREYTAGDLASRTMGVGQIRAILSGVVLNSLLSGIFSLMNFGLLFYYSVPLSILAITLVALNVISLYIFGQMQVTKQRALLEDRGKLDGVVLQLLSGVSKFRVTGSETRAFIHWLKHFTKTAKTSVESSKLSNIQSVFNSGFSLFATVMIYITLIVFSDKSHVSTGQFLAFNAAFGSFVGAMLSLSSGFLDLYEILPIYERSKPIFDAKPENDNTKEAPEKITGAVEISAIKFRYKPEDNYTLNGLSISIKPGEYVALVGPSGSGKSTIIRLLLGFETAESGSILYDGQELQNLDTRLLRRELGVVLQDGQLMPGDIFTNIIGASTTLGLDEAWEAAKASGLEQDIKDMPMGMHTVVSEGAGTLSGGQKQRIMIARSIVHKPKILIFDEATSALDNKTQAIVTESLNNLQATRIVIAHRLSTILEADRIFYLEGGQVAEEGSFEELMALNGKFKKLAERQLE